MNYAFKYSDGKTCLRVLGKTHVVHSGSLTSLRDDEHSDIHSDNCKNILI